MSKLIDKHMLTTAQHKMYTASIDQICWWRENPVEACEALLGIRLLDYQSWILQRMWVAKYTLLVVTRNGSKTVLSSIITMLQQILFPEGELYIGSKTGAQTKKLFGYIERLGTNSLSAFGDLPDIYNREIKRANDHISGFSHDPSGFKVTLLNESYVRTLNGISENNRGELIAHTH